MQVRLDIPILFFFVTALLCVYTTMFHHQMKQANSMLRTRLINSLGKLGVYMRLGNELLFIPFCKDTLPLQLDQYISYQVILGIAFH